MKKLLVCLGLSLTFSPLAVNAGEHIALGAGIDGINNGNSTGNFSVEYRSQPILQEFVESIVPFTVKPRPTIGFSFTSNEDKYGYAGFHFDVTVSENWVVTPNAVVGAYSEGSDGRDLGGALQFRTGIEASYIFENDSRLGATFNHTSNARIYDENPGTESLMVIYSHPVDIW